MQTLWLSALLFSVSLVSSHAQSAPSAPSAAVASVASCSQSKPQQPEFQLTEPPPQPTVPDLTRYLNKPTLLTFCTSQVGSFNDRDPQIIFIGDSITQGWLSTGRAVWEANFAPLGALDFGVSGDQTQHVLWRMSVYPIQRFHPKVAVILIGTNNLHNTPEEIAAGVKAIIARTQQLYPGIHIILNSIMPNRRANELMMATDAILRTFADGDRVIYLDLVPLMPPVGDTWKGLGPGALHPTADGYQLWADALLPLVHRFVPALSDTSEAAPTHPQ